MLSLHPWSSSGADLATIHGHWHVKRAMEIAAAGGHNLLLRGATGVGKTLLAQAFPSLLPAMTPEEQYEVTSRYGAWGLLTAAHPIVTERPFYVLVPASITVEGAGEKKSDWYEKLALAHHGGLLLDNLATFKSGVIKALGVALAQHAITSGEGRHRVVIPLSVQIVTTMLPCLCGFFQAPQNVCRCTAKEILRYRQRVPGPLQPYFDLTVEVPRQDDQRTQSVVPEESSAQVRQRVQAARIIQWQRFAGTRITCNAEMEQAELEQYCSLEKSGQTLLNTAIKELSLDAKDVQRLLKVARTIADLEARQVIAPQHLAEAILSYRRSPKERQREEE